MQETTSISKGGIVVAETQHKMVLSTTEPNNGINLVRIRQGDVLTQKFVVEVVEHGKLKTFDGLVPFFINTTKFGENQPVEQKVQEYSPAQARLVYTLSEPDWQWGGENTAHFSFRSLNGDGTWSEQFSTQDFTYRVISGISRSQLRDSGYVWTFEDLLRKFKDYMDQGKNDWEQWLEDNREILENIDPGGTIINILNEAKGDYDSLADRLEDIQNKKLATPIGSDQIVPGKSKTVIEDSGKYVEVEPKNLTQVINGLDKKQFNMAFVTDTHMDSHVMMVDGIRPEGFKLRDRWQVIRRFQELGKETDVMVYGGDNTDGYSGSVGDGLNIVPGRNRRYKNLKMQQRFAALATAGQRVPVVLCKGNHETGKIPYAWNDRTPENSLTGADIAELYGGSYGPVLFPDKKIAIYRLNTDDYSDALGSDGTFIEYSGKQQSGGAAGQLGQTQINDFGKWLEQLDREYHVVLVGHVPIERENDVTNVTQLATLLDGFKQGANVTVDYNSLAGYNTEPLGKVTYNFTEKGAGVIVGYFCGHWHYETARMLGTTNIVVFTTGFPQDKTLIGTELESSFANIEVNKTKRTVSIKGVGQYTDRSFSY
ncbi:BppU family phage baseplate upper protein [Enterococcus faecium]|uniref:BppU family phage baseplate upper protein n=2 Tax=Enterococcus faecium TaxID=1352 RepID=UPI003B22352B